MSDFVFLDFETPYCEKSKFSLQKQTYEQYIRDERFFVHGLGYKINDGPTLYVYGDNNIRSTLLKLFPPGNQNILVAHNTLFDGAVLSWYYKLQAATYYCTQSMARAIWNQLSNSLAEVVKRCCPDDNTLRKTKELESFNGILRPLTDKEQETLGAYCKNDINIMFASFAVMYRWLPEISFTIMDISLQGFIHPGFILDRTRVEKYLEQVTKEKNDAVATSGLPESILSSNDQFAEWIIAQGISFSKIPSPTPKNPNNEKWPLAQNSQEFIAIQADNPQHADVWNARLLVKSTIERSRALRLLDHAQISHINTDGTIALPLTFAAAHTKRFGGTNKINPQNFKRGSELRKALCAPPGYLVGVADLSNIEARVLAWLADEFEILEAFARKEDQYIRFAESVFKRPLTKEDNPTERHVGKVCELGLGFGMAAQTLRLTLAGGAMGGPRLYFSMQECIEMVYTFRSRHASTVAYWKFLDRMLMGMCQEGFHYEHKGIIFEYRRVTLPNGMIMNYPDLQGHENPNGGYDFTYYNGKFHTKIYGGKFCENITQAFAQAIIWAQMGEIQPYLKMKGGRIFLQVHDELVFLIPVTVAEEALQHVLYLMRIAPPFCNDGTLVLDAEGGLDNNYSK